MMPFYLASVVWLKEYVDHATMSIPNPFDTYSLSLKLMIWHSVSNLVWSVF